MGQASRPRGYNGTEQPDEGTEKFHGALEDHHATLHGSIWGGRDCGSLCRSTGARRATRDQYAYVEWNANQCAAGSERDGDSSRNHD